MQDDRFFQEHKVEDNFAALFDDLPGFVYFIKDSQLRYVAYNQRLCEIFNASHPDELLGQTDDPFYPKHLLEFVRQDDLRVLESGESVINRIELVPRGSGFVDWSTTTKKPLKNQQGDICGIIGVTRPFEQGTMTMRKNEELGPALRLLHEGYRDNVSIESLAKACHCSSSTFLRKFKACFNMTPKEYLRHLRIQEACHLITRTTRSFAEISYQCGFSDQSHFSREFTRIMREPPSSYRARFQI